MADWRVAVLKNLGAPPTKQNLSFLSAWQRWEGGHTNNDARFNWLNTTMGSGFPSMNSVGVRVYPNFATGARMTAQTILNGKYQNLVQGLRKGDPTSVDISGDLSTWVSGSPTGNPEYAQKILGTKGSALPIPEEAAPEVSKPATIKKGQSLEKLLIRRNQAVKQNYLDFVSNYLTTGSVSAGSLAQLMGGMENLPKVVDTKGSVKPPKAKQGKARPKSSELAGGVIDKVLAAAHKQVGQPYVWGGESRSEGGFDCSGLIQWAYEQVGIQIPRVTYDQINAGKPVKWGQFKPGDLIFSNGGGHVTMYVGGGKVIAAPQRGTVVQYQPVSRFKNSFVGARRIVD